MTNTETETLKQITNLLHNKTSETKTHHNNDNSHGTDMRVPLQTDKNQNHNKAETTTKEPQVANQQKQATEETEASNATYQHSNQYKKCQANKNKCCGKLAATQDTIVATAHYAKQIL